MSSFSLGQMNQLGDAMEAAGLTAKHVTRLGQSSALLENLRKVLDGAATIALSVIEHLIDLSAPCELPFNTAERVSEAKSGVVKLERRGDDLYFDGKKIELFLSKKQKGDSYIVGYDLRTELEKRGGNVSAKVLDHLVEHPELWPESWKNDSQGNTIYVYFWDDIFRHPSDGFLYVRYGCWRSGRVVSFSVWLALDWGRQDPAASVAS